MKHILALLTALLLAPLAALYGAESGSHPKNATKPASLPGEIQPANPNLISEARNVLAYLKSIEGKKTLTGISDSGGWRSFYEWSGRAPATYSVDCFNLRKPRFGPEYLQGLQKSIDITKYWWEEKGGILSMHFHWGKPGNPAGIAWIKDQKYNKGSGPMDMAKFVTPGTAEHTAAMADLKRTADYLDQLNKAHVPVLWRPLHEIDGGWFWWTDQAKPENTAAAYRMVFDYFVKERKLNNLIWVFNPGSRCGGYHQQRGPKKAAANLAEEIAFRKRYYPGDQYVDIAGIDIYPNPSEGYEDPPKDSYRKAYEIMEGVAPGKMHALCESAGLVNPEKLAADTPNWLYDLAWFAGHKSNPPEWVRSCCSHPRYLTADQLPLFGQHNVAPDVRMLQPLDGAEIGASVELQAVAGERNGDLKNVAYYLLPGPWKDWTVRDPLDVDGVLAAATKLGEAQLNSTGQYSFTWSNIKPGFYDLAAVAWNTAGKKTLSRVVRVAAGVKNLAYKKTATSSAGPQSNPDHAVDGDLITAWRSDTKGEQWLSVDLGSEQTIGAATLTWWRYYASTYVLQGSNDGTQWREIFRQPKKTGKSGDTDVIRFTPLKPVTSAFSARKPPTTRVCSACSSSGSLKPCPSRSPERLPWL